MNGEWNDLAALDSVVVKEKAGNVVWVRVGSVQHQAQVLKDFLEGSQAGHCEVTPLPLADMVGTTS